MNSISIVLGERAAAKRSSRFITLQEIIFNSIDGSYLCYTALLACQRSCDQTFNQVPLGEDVVEYFQREVEPHVPDAWIDHDKTKIGYEIPFNRHFYVFQPPRELDEIDTESVSRWALAAGSSVWVTDTR